MALTPKQRAEKIERMLEQHAVARKTAGTHLTRLVDTLARLDEISDELEMNAQHRAVTEDLREQVSNALRETAALHDATARKVGVQADPASKQDEQASPNGRGEVRALSSVSEPWS